MYSCSRDDTANTISICSWNVHGSLALKLTMPRFTDLLRDFDVILLQETFLRPGQEDSVVLPDGFSIFAASRPDSRAMAQQAGGVATLVRDTLRPRRLPCTTTADVLPILVRDELIVLNVYLAPPSSPWLSHDDIPPEQAMNECIASLAGQVDRGIHLCVMGDLNARTSSLSAQPLLYPRISPDAAPVSTRGRSLLSTCEEFDLVFLNGTYYCVESPNRLRLTSQYREPVP